MNTYYSKTLGVTLERQDSFLERNEALVARAAKATEALSAAPVRAHCPLCEAAAPESPDFTHRGAAYVRCTVCGHVASLHDPRFLKQDVEQYAKVYPPLEGAEREARRLSVYQPKLDWVLESCRNDLGQTRESVLARPWMEVGCGEGLFLESLQLLGATNARGLEADSIMAERCAGLLGEGRVEIPKRPLARELSERRFSVLAAWYVLEHVEGIHEVSQALAALPSGTLFCFAVPMFSLSVLLESSLHGHFARTLDNSVHTQLFTDASIDYFLASAGFEKASQWVFGQDAMDLGRIIRLGMAAHYSGPMADEVNAMLSGAYEDLQGVFDRHFLSDSRHVLAVKR